jgi:hypothetical protein
LLVKRRQRYYDEVVDECDIDEDEDDDYLTEKKEKMMLYRHKKRGTL